MEHQKLEHQHVEHANVVYIVTVIISDHTTCACINGKRHKVYPTGNALEPWTTNISLMR